ncbi:MAG: nuclear transport factor 2 family protein [Xanthomonadales bacterium]|nr:nuclear transport factor 2 family protein [Xanthomonadales bacterium]
MSIAERSIHRWHEVVRSGDPAALMALLEDDVTFHSPVVHTPQEGARITALYLNAAHRVLVNETFRYVREAHQDQLSVLEFLVTVDGIEINAVDMIQWSDQGKIVDFKVMVRPAKAMNLLHGKMAEMLQSLSGSQPPNP